MAEATQIRRGVALAAAAPRDCTNALTRKRARFGTAKLKSHSRFSS